jgi:hypothetical protein
MKDPAKPRRKSENPNTCKKHFGKRTLLPFGPLEFPSLCIGCRGWRESHSGRSIKRNGASQTFRAESPGKDRSSNSLPIGAPDAPFFVLLVEVNGTPD